METAVLMDYFSAGGAAYSKKGVFLYIYEISESNLTLGWSAEATEHLKQAHEVKTL